MHEHHKLFIWFVTRLKSNHDKANDFIYYLKPYERIVCRAQLCGEFLYSSSLLLRVLFENRPALYFCNYKENK